MIFIIKDVTATDLVLDYQGTFWNMPIGYAIIMGITRDKQKIGGIIQMQLHYGCCNLFLKYEHHFSNWNIEPDFCPFCGTKLKDEVQYNSSKQNQKEEEK